MTSDLSALTRAPRLLFSIPLEPLQGKRFQPTGFPGLGAATYETTNGTSLLVESAQSVANRLEKTIWDDVLQDVIPELSGLSHVRVMRKDQFLTDTILEAHRLNSPYLLAGKDDTLLKALRTELGVLEKGPIDRRKLAQVLLKYDVGSLLHGVFLAKKELAGGRLRVARALSAFIEAEGVRPAPSGGVKNDHVDHSGDAKNGFGNIPFARDEFTAERITLYVNLDLSMLRGYGLGAEAENLLVILSLLKLRLLLSDSLRLRTACDLRPLSSTITATAPESFALPLLEDLIPALKAAIQTNKARMTVTTVSYNDEFKQSKEKIKAGQQDDEDSTEARVGS